MSKYFLRVNLSEMYACKHAIQNVLRQKIKKLDEINAIEISEVTPEVYENREMLEKDIIQEKVLLEKIVLNIEKYKVVHGDYRNIQ